MSHSHRTRVGNAKKKRTKTHVVCAAFIFFRQLWDVFDMIVGTSIGGVIAILIGLFQIKASRIQSLILDLCPKLFRQRKRWVFAGMKALHQALGTMYNASPLVEALDKVLKDNCKDYDAQTCTVRKMGSKAPVRVFVTTVDDETSGKCLLVYARYFLWRKKCNSN